jgi:hypothetical protein
VNGRDGQTAERQFDGLANLGEALGQALNQPVKALWSMQNGYALCTSAGLDAMAKHLGALHPEQVDTAASIRAKGANTANLWRAWKAYKDVAHLVAAAAVISAQARILASVKPFGKSGLPSGQILLLPFLIAMLMPDFVISLALSFQEYGLSSIPQSREQPMLDPDTLWRVPPEIGAVAVPPPPRKVDQTGIAILNARRAGNRGKSKVAKTTPVSG